MIAAYVGEVHHEWDKYLPQFGFTICSSINESIKCTLPELFLGRKILTPFERHTALTDADAQCPSKTRLLETAKRAQANLMAAKEKQKKYYDLKHCQFTFTVGRFCIKVHVH